MKYLNNSLTTRIKMIYTQEEKSFLVEKYIELKSYSAVQRAFRLKWHKTKAPHHNTIKDFYNKFLKNGSSIDVARTLLADVEKREEAKILIENLVSKFRNFRNYRRDE